MRKEIALSLILAIGVVGGVIWIADRSLTPNALKPGLIAMESRQVSGQQPQTETWTGRTAASHGISKCILDGQTIYSNQACPAGASQEELVLYDSAGILDKSKEQLAALAALNRPQIRHEIVTVQTAPAPAQRKKQDKKLECDQLDKQIERLDAMARQPQTAASMDRIREARKKARDRQFALRC